MNAGAVAFKIELGQEGGTPHVSVTALRLGEEQSCPHITTNAKRPAVGWEVEYMIPAKNTTGLDFLELAWKALSGYRSRQHSYGPEMETRMRAVPPEESRLASPDRARFLSSRVD